MITMTLLLEDSMKAHIIRMGKSQGIHLPKALLKKAKLGSDVELRSEPGWIVISNMRNPRIGWAEAAQRMRAHCEDHLVDPYVSTRFDQEDWKWE